MRMNKVYVKSEALLGRSGHEAGRQLLARMYREVCGEDCPEIRIGERGKPYFAEGPWHFSISHTKNHAFCVLADVPVGLDAEEMDRDIRLELAPKILSAGELAQFQAAEDPWLTLLRFWVLKEAQGKLSGQGMKWHPTHTNFILPDSRIREMDGCLVAIIR